MHLGIFPSGFFDFPLSDMVEINDLAGCVETAGSGFGGGAVDAKSSFFSPLLSFSRALNVKTFGSDFNPRSVTACYSTATTAAGASTDQGLLEIERLRRNEAIESISLAVCSSQLSRRFQ